MTLSEAIARRELEWFMDIRVVGKFNDKYLWADINLAKIEYAYYQYLRYAYPCPKKRISVAREISWEVWIKTTDEPYTRMIEGYNFEKRYTLVFQAGSIFIDGYKNIYEKYVGNGGDIRLYKHLFIQFLKERNIDGRGLYAETVQSI